MPPRGQRQRLRQACRHRQRRAAAQGPQCGSDPKATESGCGTCAMSLGSHEAGARLDAGIAGFAVKNSMIVDSGSAVPNHGLAPLRSYLSSLEDRRYPCGANKALICQCVQASRVISDKNQVRRSVSSIQFSIKLAVATSLCWSQISCVARKERVSCWLSSQSSPIISCGLTPPYCCLLAVDF